MCAQSHNATKGQLSRMGRNAMLCAAGLVFIVAVLIVCINIITHEVENSYGQFMSEVAEVESDNMRAAIEDKFSVLHGVSALVTTENINDDEGLLGRFREVVDSGVFSRVGLVNLEGRGIGYDSSLGVLPVENYADRDYVQAALRGNDFVVGPMSDIHTNEHGVVFAVPVYNLKHNATEPIGVLVGLTSTQAFAEMIDISLFEGNGYVHIIDSTGAILFNSPRGMASANENILSTEYQQTRPIADIEADLAAGRGGTVEFTRTDGESMISIYRPIGINDWFVDVVLPSDYVDDKNRMILLAVTGLAVFVVLVVVLLMFAILRTQRRSQRALEAAALTDTLTGIDNELAFKRACSAHPEYFDGKHCLVLFNLVGFSLFNIIFGYPKGSELLQQVAHILVQSVSKNELVARLSGDRFLLLLESHNPSQDEQALLRAMDEIDAAIQPCDTQYRIESQCCTYRLCAQDANRDINLIVQDMAVPLKQARDRVGTRIVHFDERNVAEANRARQIEAIMTSALSQEEFIAYFQPQYDIRGDDTRDGNGDGATRSSGDVCNDASRNGIVTRSSASRGNISRNPILCGAEALVRWQSPVLGFVTPAEFIPIFERNGSIAKIDEYMLERTCIRLREWLDAGLTCVPISVNLSRRNLFSSDLISRIKRMVDAYEIPTHLIKFELTESIVSENEQQLIGAVDELRAHGFKVSLDDFGTGYSAFSAITDIAFDSVKLDRSFFGESMETDLGRKAIIGVIQLLDQLGFETVAEGIETEAEVELLRMWGCEVVQGFVYGRPLPAEDFVREHLQPAQSSIENAEVNSAAENAESFS